MGGSIVLFSVQIGENLVRVIINDTGLIILILILIMTQDQNMQVYNPFTVLKLDQLLTILFNEISS